jgi:cobalt-zinc-cadmium efflux system outer membrane protein
MKQKIYAVVFAASLAGNLSGAEGPTDFAPPTNSLTLDAVLAEVLAKNPSLKAARANWQAMEARVSQERAWADPRVGVDVERSGTTRPFTFTDNEWMISQELPLSGKNRRRARAAGAEAAATYAQADRRRLELILDARIAFYNLLNAQAQIDLNQKNAELLQRFTEITRTKYEVGTRLQSDVLMAQTDALKNQEARRDLEQRLAEAQFRLNVLMNRPPGMPLGRPSAPEIPAPKYNIADIETSALLQRPEIRIAAQKIAAANARQDVARRAWFPDPELRIEARQFNGGGGRIQEYDTGVFFSFPWFNRGKYKAGIEEAKKNRESAEYELAALENETRGLVREHLRRIETMHHHLVLFRDNIAPLARQNVTAARLAYETDKAGFLDLIVAQRALQEVESMAQQHLTSYLSALAELEALVGADLNSPPSSSEKKESP